MTPVRTPPVTTAARNSSRAIRKQWVRWVSCFLGVSALLMGSVVAFILVVDPYQIYHPVLGGRPMFDLRTQRFLVPGLARTGDYEIALAGTSFLQNIPNSAAGRICGRKVINLCISGASIHEEALTLALALALALKHKGTRTVIATLDYNSLSGGARDQVAGVNLPFPPYLYDNSVLDKLPYLLSLDSITTSFHTLYGQPGDWETRNADWPWKFPASMKFGGGNAVRDIDPANINKRYGMTNLKLDDMEKAFAANIFPLLEKDRNVKIHFVFAPYSILVWHDYAQRGQIETYFAFKRWVLKRSERFGNFDLVDFQDRADIITDYSRYADIYHADESVDEQMVDAACHGKDLLNERNIEPRMSSLLELVKTTNPFEIVKDAGTGGLAGKRAALNLAPAPYAVSK